MKDIILLALIFMCSFFSLANAQENNAGLRVGRQAPSLRGAEKWLRGDPITDLQKGRLYIIEFGATWCTPCAAAIPHLSTLATQYSESLTVVSCFVKEDYRASDAKGKPIYAERVARYIEKRNDKIQYSVVLDGSAGILDSTWLTQSGTVGVPQIFLVDKTGIILWIGSDLKVLDALVAKAVTENTSESAIKSETNNVITKFDPFAMANDPARKPIYLSMLAAFNPDAQPFANTPFVDNFRYNSVPQLIPNRGKIQLQGVSLRRLYDMAFGDTLWYMVPTMILQSGQYFDTLKTPHQKRAYGKYWYRPLLHVKDSSEFTCDFNLPDNRYDYLLKVPLEKGSSKFMQQAMQRDLRTYFDYEVTVEKRMMPCWYLELGDKGGPQFGDGTKYRQYIDATGNYRYENADVRNIIAELELRFGYSAWGSLIDQPGVQPPFFDHTGIKEKKINYWFEGKIIDMINESKNRPDTFGDFVTLLHKSGFKLVKGERLLKVVVIRDANHNRDQNTKRPY